jgi:hypothetical protein
MDIFTTAAMTGKRIDCVMSPVTMNSEAGIARIETQGEVMGPAIEPRAPCDVLHPLVELLDRVAVDVEQKKAEIDEVGIGLVFNLFDDPRDMRAGEFGKDAFWRRWPRNTLAAHHHRGVEVERELVQHHGHAGLVVKPEILAQMKA